MCAKGINFSCVYAIGFWNCPKNGIICVSFCDQFKVHIVLNKLTNTNIISLYVYQFHLIDFIQHHDDLICLIWWLFRVISLCGSINVR